MSAYQDDVKRLELVKPKGSYLWRVLLKSCGIFPPSFHTVGNRDGCFPAPLKPSETDFKRTTQKASCALPDYRVTVHTILYTKGDHRAVSIGNEGHIGLGSDSY